MITLIHSHSFRMPSPSQASSKPLVVFGGKLSTVDVPEPHRQAMQDHLDKVHSPLFRWMAASNPPLKRWAGRIVNWAYWLWQGFVKDLKHIQHSLFKSSKPTVEKP